MTSMTQTRAFFVDEDNVTGVQINLEINQAQPDAAFVIINITGPNMIPQSLILTEEQTRMILEVLNSNTDF